MRSPCGLQFSLLLEAFQPELTDGFQHDESRCFPFALRLLHQALVDKRCHALKHIQWLLLICHTDSRSSLERTASHEDGEPAEEVLFLLAQEVVAPLDGVAQCLLAGGQIACATGEDVESAREAFEERLWREQFDT